MANTNLNVEIYKVIFTKGRYDNMSKVFVGRANSVNDERVVTYDSPVKLYLEPLYFMRQLLNDDSLTDDNLDGKVFYVRCDLNVYFGKVAAIAVYYSESEAIHCSKYRLMHFGMGRDSQLTEWLYRRMNNQGTPRMTNPMKVSFDTDPITVNMDIPLILRKEFVKMTRKRNEPLPAIKDVKFNGPATIIFWTDGSKTVVKAQDGEEIDYEKGLAMAIAKKALGNMGNYYNTFDKYLPKVESFEERCEMYKKELDNMSDKLKVIEQDLLTMKISEKGAE